MRTRALSDAPAAAADFVERGTTQGLETTPCDGAVVVPPFALSD